MELIVGGIKQEEENPVVCVDYTNWRGERMLRRIVPQRLYLAEVEWHAGSQWILDAWDVEKEAIRSFAMKDIKSWVPEQPESIAA
jgi:predicted DNA-binding transcriptional regulator YafY